MSLPKGFISTGRGNWLNIDCIELDKSYIDTKSKKAIIIDKYDIKYVIPFKLIKDKLELKLN